MVDNCVVEGFYDNVLVQEPPSGSLSNVRIRRTQVLDAFSGSGTGRPQGMYASGVDGLVLEGNLFDHNGWKDGVSSPTVFSHNVYTADCTNLTVKGNIFSNASSFGLIVQSSATGNIVNPDIENNLRDANALSLLYESLASAHRRAGARGEAAATDARRRALWQHWDTRLPGNAFVARRLATVSP